MKAVVMETKNGSSVVLREDGIFEKVNKTYEVGQTIEWNASLSAHRKRNYRRIYRYVGAAACFAAVVTAGLGTTYQTAFACSYVSVDVNPSIEFTLNRMNRVLSVSGLNEDAQAIVEELNARGIRFDTLETALDKTQTVLQEQNYLTDSDAILIDISSDDPKRLSALTQKVERSINPSESSGEALHLTTSSLTDRNEAHTNQISTGRYGAMKKEAEQNGTLITPADFETFRELPVEKLFETDPNTSDAPNQHPDDGQPDAGQPDAEQPDGEQPFFRPEHESERPAASGSQEKPAPDSRETTPSETSAQQMPAQPEPIQPEPAQTESFQPESEAENPASKEDSQFPYSPDEESPELPPPSVPPHAF